MAAAVVDRAAAGRRGSRDGRPTSAGGRAELGAQSGCKAMDGAADLLALLPGQFTLSDRYLKIICAILTGFQSSTWSLRQPLLQA